MTDNSLCDDQEMKCLLLLGITAVIGLYIVLGIFQLCSVVKIKHILCLFCCFFVFSLCLE